VKKFWLVLFWLSALGEITAVTVDIAWLHIASKPVLLLALFGYFFVASKGFPKWRILVLASLVFSWAGDVFLMFDSFFLPGLIAFLIAHLFYLFVYVKTGANLKRIRIWPLLLLIAYGAALLLFLFGHLGDLAVPVVVYALVLLAMAGFAFQRNGFTSVDSYRLVTIGAMLFVLSDSLLAINQFVSPIPLASFGVMGTYIGAQFLIVKGLIHHNNRA